MLWDEILTESTQIGFEPNKVLQEHLQKAVLTALSHGNAFRSLVFQGGTALRLFYGNPRISEELQFVLHSSQSSFDFLEQLKKLPSSLEPQFPFLKTIIVQLQKHDKNLQRGILTTISDEPLQRIRLHIELASVPSYQNILKILPFPPLQPAVRVETPTEILADKLLALGCRDYIKGRDLWDIYFLTTEKQVSPPWTLVWQKTKDYHTTRSAVQSQLKEVRTHLKKEGAHILSNELQRFLPSTVFASYQTIFKDIIIHINQLLNQMPERGVRDESR
jgi:predicted nucleotidyltransferase component of viral defense system